MRRLVLIVALCLAPAFAYAQEQPQPKDTKESLKLKITALEWEARYCQERMQNLDTQYKVLVEQYRQLAEQSPPQPREQK